MKLIKNFYKQKLIIRTPPTNLKKEDLFLFGKFEYLIPSSGLYLIKNARVTSIGIIYKFLFSIKSFIVCYDYDFKKYRFRYFIKSFFLCKHRKLSKRKDYIIIFDNYSGPNGFAHWLCDGLTRIAETNDFIDRYIVLLPEYFKDEALYLESLSFFNIKEIEYLQKNTISKIQNLYVPSHICGTGNFNPENLKKTRDIILPQLNTNNFNDEYIYISRGKSKRRFIENEKEVVSLMEKHDFKIIFMEDYLLSQQIQIISQAKIVISIHGAALSLIMFMKEKSIVLELRSKNDNINNMFFNLACAVNVNYYYLLCNFKNISEYANNFNLVVDILELDNEVKLLKNNI